MGFKSTVKERILVDTARHCCVCHRYRGAKVEVHHIKQEALGGENTYENAIALCFDCHADAGHYNPKHPKGTKLSPSELKKAKENWIALVKANNINEANGPDPKPKTLKKPTIIPLIDLELERVKSDPEFVHFEIQFAYDIFLHNKSNVPISHINLSRTVIPNKNRQKIAVHYNTQGKLGPFHKKINVLAPGEKEKIRREHSSSYEYSKFTIIYRDGYGTFFKCIFEGDRDGVNLISNHEVIFTKDKS